jgi:cell division transport system permease protein
MFLATAVRVTRFAVQDMFRNAWLTVATVSVLALTLVFVNLLLAVNVLGDLAVSSLQSRVDVSVHFRPDAEESRVQTVQIALLSMPEVKDVTYVSPAEALQAFSEANSDDPRVIESLGEVGANPFGATLVIRARELDGYEAVLAALDNPAFAGLIEDRDFEDRQALIARLDGLSRRIQLAGFGVSAVFVLITVLIVWNTIRMSIYTRRDEIGIMRLVGASDRFIRAPFYVQSVAWGLLALAVSLAVILPSLHVSEPLIGRFFGTPVDILGFFRSNWWRIAGTEVVAVILVAVLTTKAATARYLKV